MSNIKRVNCHTSSHYLALGATLHPHIEHQLMFQLSAMQTQGKFRFLPHVILCNYRPREIKTGWPVVFTQHPLYNNNRSLIHEMDKLT